MPPIRAQIVLQQPVLGVGVGVGVGENDGGGGGKSGVLELLEYEVV